MKYDFLESSQISADDLQKYISQLATDMLKIKAAFSDGYNTPYAFAQVPFDDQGYSTVQAMVHKKKQLQPTLLVLIGIGGSSLGTLAVYQALAHTLHATCKLLCVDTIGMQYTNNMYAQIDAELHAGNRVLFVVISKSGKTTETLVNAALLFDLLKTHHPQDYHDYWMVITDEHSSLWRLAHAQGFDALAIPAQLGGRFSVFSAVGLFPLAFLGVDILRLCAGARDAYAMSVVPEMSNMSALSAASIYHHYRQGKMVHDLFLFAPELAGVGAWYRQLMGESLGKRHDTTGVVVEVGITPTVSIGTNDLHSVVQLYLAGPRNAVTTFVRTAAGGDFIIPDNHFSQIDSVGAGRAVADVYNAIVDGTRAAFMQDRRPYVTITMATDDAYELGLFLHIKMFEIVYLAALLQVNPFDQPQVELYKLHTRAILGRMTI